MKDVISNALLELDRADGTCAYIAYICLAKDTADRGEHNEGNLRLEQFRETSDSNAVIHTAELLEEVGELWDREDLNAYEYLDSIDWSSGTPFCYAIENVSTHEFLYGNLHTVQQFEDKYGQAESAWHDEEVEECLKESVDWSYFDKFEEVSDKYLPDTGEGETMASQCVTAITKLVYKWYNDGDVYDNRYALEGWANDLSSYANWLHRFVPGADEILDMIEDISYIDAESEYEFILKQLCDKFFNEEFLQTLDKPKQGSIYKQDGPFEFKDEEDEYDEYYDESLTEDTDPEFIIVDRNGRQLSSPNTDDGELWDRVSSMEARGQRGLKVVAYTSDYRKRSEENNKVNTEDQDRDINKSICRSVWVGILQIKDLLTSINNNNCSTESVSQCAEMILECAQQIVEDSKRFRY